jgi:hypothetical protein
MLVPPVEPTPIEASASSPVQASGSLPVEASVSSPVEASGSSPVEAPVEASGSLPLEEIHKPRGRQFEPGRSGNPNGRPKGSRNRITSIMQEQIDDKAEALLAKAIEKALKGDASMLRALLSRTLAPLRARTVELELPTIKTAADAPAASAAVLAACCRGEISPADAETIMAMIKMHAEIVEGTDLEARLSAVESNQQK